MLDPVISTILSIGFGLMLLLAAVHKLSAHAHFRAILADYRVLPASLVAPVAFLLPLLEVALGLAWLFSSLQAWIPTVALLMVYTLGIAINLLRGRVHISCGCGFGKSTGSSDALHPGLVIRNAGLILAAVVAALPVSTRTVGALDYMTLVAALLVVILVFAAANQLVRNAAAINSWRQRADRDD
ncbi:MAG: MauE/DoxX family redox-associated membrane protein [Woeseiaceae bacterium]|jgi:hypothetical protein